MTKFVREKPRVINISAIGTVSVQLKSLLETVLIRTEAAKILENEVSWS
jgi:hypothetical protein